VLIKPDSGMKTDFICHDRIVSNRAGMPCMRQTSAQSSVINFAQSILSSAPHEKTVAMKDNTPHRACTQAAGNSLRQLMDFTCSPL